MTENGLFVLGGPETQLHDIRWAVHDGKNYGRSEGDSTDETKTQVMQNANTAGAWERKFEKAMEKMGKIKGNQQSVEIRKVCWKVNKGQ